MAQKSKTHRQTRHKTWMPAPIHSNETQEQTQGRQSLFEAGSHASWRWLSCSGYKKKKHHAIGAPVPWPLGGKRNPPIAEKHHTTRTSMFTHKTQTIVIMYACHARTLLLLQRLQPQEPYKGTHQRNMERRRPRDPSHRDNTKPAVHEKQAKNTPFLGKIVQTPKRPTRRPPRFCDKAGTARIIFLSSGDKDFS